MCPCLVLEVLWFNFEAANCYYLNYWRRFKTRELSYEQTLDCTDIRFVFMCLEKELSQIIVLDQNNNCFYVYNVYIKIALVFYCN